MGSERKHFDNCIKLRGACECNCKSIAHTYALWEEEARNAEREKMFAAMREYTKRTGKPAFMVRVLPGRHLVSE